MGRFLAWVGLGLSLSGCNTALDLGSNDAGAPYYDAACKPGTYAGTYWCTSASDSSFQIPNDGPIAITLSPTGGRTLGLTRDASLSSASSGLAFSANVTGTLDCSTRKLTGEIDNITFSSTAFHGVITGVGAFNAVYDVDASPPALVAGVIDPPIGVSSTCTWTATLE